MKAFLVISLIAIICANAQVVDESSTGSSSTTTGSSSPSGSSSGNDSLIIEEPELHCNESSKMSWSQWKDCPLGDSALTPYKIGLGAAAFAILVLIALWIKYRDRCCACCGKPSDELLALEAAALNKIQQTAERKYNEVGAATGLNNALPSVSGAAGLISSNIDQKLGLTNIQLSQQPRGANAV